VDAGNKRTFCVTFPTAPTAATDLVSVLSATGTVTRLRRLIVTNPGNQTTGALVNLVVASVGSALGSGGSAVTPVAVEPGDLKASSYRSGDTTVAAGVASPVQYTVPIYVPTTLATAAPLVLEFGGPGGMTTKCPTATATVGLVIRHPGAAGAASFSGFAEFTEESAP
jgi:hypothetical protein